MISGYIVFVAVAIVSVALTYNDDITIFLLSLDPLMAYAVMVGMTGILMVLLESMTFCVCRHTDLDQNEMNEINDKTELNNKTKIHEEINYDGVDTTPTHSRITRDSLKNSNDQMMHYLQSSRDYLDVTPDDFIEEYDSSWTPYFFPFHIFHFIFYF